MRNAFKIWLLCTRYISQEIAPSLPMHKLCSLLISALSGPERRRGRHFRTRRGDFGVLTFPAELGATAQPSFELQQRQRCPWNPLLQLHLVVPFVRL